jgi:hypothetical protein
LRDSIIGHGRRSKQAHDEDQDWISVRRGICRPCHKTFTFLPPFSPPYSHYSLIRGGGYYLYQTFRRALADAAKRADCSGQVTPHRLRHSWATEMLRLGVSLPALMQLLGHKDIRMTLRYVQVTQQDLQREFHLARLNAVQPHRLPALSVPNPTASANLPAIRQALAAARHLLQRYRRQIRDDQTRRKLQRLARQLLAIAGQLDRITKPEK